jgi:hypothetical protein
MKQETLEHKDAHVARDQIQVLAIAEGFFQSCALFALLKLRVFELIGEGSRNRAELAEELCTRPETPLDEAVLKSAPTIDPSAHLGADENHTREFALAMHNYAAIRGKELARYLNTTQNKTLLDLGCGPGTYAFHLGVRNPKLRLGERWPILLDLIQLCITSAGRNHSVDETRGWLQEAGFQM